jgi:hypothetical protein
LEALTLNDFPPASANVEEFEHIPYCLADKLEDLNVNSFGEACPV